MRDGVDTKRTTSCQTYAHTDTHTIIILYVYGESCGVESDSRVSGGEDCRENSAFNVIDIVVMDGNIKAVGRWRYRFDA